MKKKFKHVIYCLIFLVCASMNLKESINFGFIGHSGYNLRQFTEEQK